MSNTKTPSPKPTGIPRLYTVEAVAESWSTTEATVRRWARNNQITAVKTPGGEWRFRLEDLRRIADGE